MTRAKDISRLITDADFAGTLTVGDLTASSLNGGQFGGRRNIIINGAMQVAQRGTSFTSNADLYTLDRFAIGHGSPVNAMTVSQETDAPTGFKYSLKVLAGTGASASTGGYAVLRQAIEGTNMYHLAFGTSSAKTITISFYVKSSLTGTFAVSIRNQAGNRAFASTYTINSANTWEYKTITIAGDTSGTWTADTGIGLHIHFDLGIGSNFDIATGAWTAGSNMFGGESTVKLTETTNATWFLTGVQLEVGSVATPFEHRSFGEELSACQRYFCKTFDYATVPANNSTTSGSFMLGNSASNYEPSVTWRYPVEMRGTPAITLFNPEAGTTSQWSAGGGTVSSNARALFTGTSSTVIDNGDVQLAGGNSWRIHATASSEL